MSGKIKEFVTLGAAFEAFVQATAAVDGAAIDDTRNRLNVKLIDETLQQKQIADAQAAAEKEAQENARKAELAQQEKEAAALKVV